MKTIAYIFLLLVASDVWALSCVDYIPSNREKISIEREDSIFYFSAPNILDKNQLRSVTLFVYPKNSNEAGALVVPVAFTVKDDIASGYFAITQNWVRAELEASYSDMVCGPRLISEVGI
jgi:hypothetical protein